MNRATPSKSSQCDVIADTSNDNQNVVDATSSEGKTVNHFDSKDLILQFTKMNVTTSQPHQEQDQRHAKAPSSNATTSTSAETSTSTSTTKVNKNWRFKAKPKSKQKQRPLKVVLRPSKLNLDKKDADSLFRDFSAACSKELDSIARLDPETRRDPISSKKKNKDPAAVPASHHHQKRRKASSCAEQARQMSSDELSDTIDILADFLEESVVFPKKMSYMAELMYT